MTVAYNSVKHHGIVHKFDFKVSIRIALTWMTDFLQSKGHFLSQFNSLIPFSQPSPVNKQRV